MIGSQERWVPTENFTLKTRQRILVSRPHLITKDESWGCVLTRPRLSARTIDPDSTFLVISRINLHLRMPVDPGPILKVAINPYFLSLLWDPRPANSPMACLRGSRGLRILKGLILYPRRILGGRQDRWKLTVLEDVILVRRFRPHEASLRASP